MATLSLKHISLATLATDGADGGSIEGSAVVSSSTAPPSVLTQRAFGGPDGRSGGAAKAGLDSTVVLSSATVLPSAFARKDPNGVRLHCSNSAESSSATLATDGAKVPGARGVGVARMMCLKKSNNK